MSIQRHDKHQGDEPGMTGGVVGLSCEPSLMFLVINAQASKISSGLWASTGALVRYEKKT